MVSDEPNARVDRRTYLKFAGSAAAAVGLAGCTGGGGDETTEETATTEETTTEETTESSSGSGSQGDFPVTITQGQLDSGLDPHDHRETTTDIIVMQSYEGALDRDAKGKVIAGLASDWERLEPGKVRLTLRDGVTFHNGDDLTPEDVAFSINRIIKEDVGGLASPQADQLAGVTGAAPVDGQNAVDVTSDGVNPMVFGLLGSYGDVVQKSWIENNDTNYINQNMNGTGPFKLDNYVQDERVEYVRYEDYWREPAAVDSLTINAASESSARVNQLVSGETDVIVNVPPQAAGRVKENGATRIAAVPSTRVIYNGMRHDVEPFSNVKFRRAMNHAVDMTSILENVLSGFGDATSQPTLEGFVGYNPDLETYAFDKAKAEQLVEESGQAGAEITLHTPNGRYLKDLEIAQAVVGYIDDLSNVSASVKQRDFGALAGELTQGDITKMPQWYLIGWGNETFDASQTLIPLLTTDGALSSWSNEEFDTAVADAQKEPDDGKREQLLQKANQIAHDQAPWIFLNRQYSVYGVNERIQWTPRRDEAIKAYAMSSK